MRRILISCMISLFFYSAAMAGAPEWLRTAIAEYEKSGMEDLYPDDEDVHSIMIWDYGTVEIQKDGSLKRHFQVAFKVLRPDGKMYRTRVHPFSDELKIKAFTAWLVRDDQPTTQIGELESIEVNPANATYDGDYQLKSLSFAENDVPIGSYVAFEIKDEFDPDFYSFSWYFQAVGQPIRQSVLKVKLPSDWSISAHFFNYEDIRPDIKDGREYTWTITDIPPTVLEESIPPLYDIAPMMILYYEPDKPAEKVFKSWDDVSGWYYPLWQKQVVADAAIAAKARELGTIPAILDYVQKNITYVAIALDYYSRYQPYPAAQTFRTKYGDCKNKAGLAAAMLDVIGVKSYPVLCSAKSSREVHPDQPSPGQFNHCILAIEDESLRGRPASVALEGQSPVLIFDPTDTHLPIGELSWELQGTHALIVTSARGVMVQLPSSRATDNQIVEELTATIDTLGAVSGEIVSHCSGEVAKEYKYFFHSMGEHKYAENWQARLRSISTISNLVVTDMEVSGLPDQGDSLQIVCRFQAPSFLKKVGNLHVFHANFYESQRSFAEDEGSRERRFPIWFEYPKKKQLTATYTLPNGYRIDEMPPLEITNSVHDIRFSIETSYHPETSQLRYQSEYQRDRSLFEREFYPEIKTFFDEYYRSSDGSVFLKK